MRAPGLIWLFQIHSIRNSMHLKTYLIRYVICWFSVLDHPPFRIDSLLGPVIAHVFAPFGGIW